MIDTDTAELLARVSHPGRDKNYFVTNEDLAALTEAEREIVMEWLDGALRSPHMADYSLAYLTDEASEAVDRYLETD